MKSKQVLSIDQMKHLQELGLDTSDASMCWCLFFGDKKEKWELEIYEDVINQKRDSSFWEIIPSFTLQDILDKLPKRIDEFELRIKMFVFDYVGHTEYKWSIIYESTDMMSYLDTLLQSSYTNLIEAAYNMLCMCALKTDMLKLERRTNYGIYNSSVY